LALALPLAALLAITTTAAPGAAHTASPPAPPPAPATIGASQRPAMLPIAIGDDATYGCVDDGRVCLSLITADGQSLPNLPDVAGDAMARQVRLALRGSGAADGAPRIIDLPLPQSLTGQELGIWPQVIAVAGPAPSLTRLLIGLTIHESAGYSGGGAFARHVALLPLTISDDGITLGRDMLIVPVEAEKMIRACFNEQDIRNRRGLCHDDYSYTAQLAIAPTSGGAAGATTAAAVAPGAAATWPDLVYSTVAMARPGFARLSNDSLDHARLTRAEMQPARDPNCSYTRTLRFNPVTGRYEFDQPGPDCADYTSP
ncbi:MAG: hypothetical protein ACKOUM_00915, partial [Sphingopyxis sp.]